MGQAEQPKDIAAHNFSFILLGRFAIEQHIVCRNAHVHQGKRGVAATDVLSDHPRFGIKQPAELNEMLFIVTVEEHLVEAGEAEDLLVAIEFYPDGDHASAGGRHADIVHHGPC